MIYGLTITKVKIIVTNLVNLFRMANFLYFGKDELKNEADSLFCNDISYCLVPCNPDLSKISCQMLKFDRQAKKTCTAKNFFVKLYCEPSAESGYGRGAGSGHIDQRLLDACS